MPMIERQDPEGLSDPSAYGCSQLAKFTTTSGLVLISGRIGEDAERCKAETFEDQMALALDSLDRALRAAGASHSAMFKITLLVVGHDESRLAQVSKARRGFRRSSASQRTRSRTMARWILDALRS
ncbi:MAG: Rid family hydrolase [Kiloniellales bacterium]|nr:Rid family hydrolase [Kiloniellales bacterium]MDJ0982326.1 Rid family hydrolase [Kiloniellales bacterium]